MSKKHDNNILKTKHIDDLLLQTSYMFHSIKLNMRSSIKRFFGVWKNEYKNKVMEKIKWINFSGFDTIKELKNIQKMLVEELEKDHNKKDKLHYTYTISRVWDRINELKFNKWQKNNWIQNLLYAVKPGDIMLINYKPKGYTRNTILVSVANYFLKILSRSTFVHVGIIWNGTSKDWFDWIHSTLNNAWWRRWVKKTWLKKYLESHNPASLLILRYNKTSKNKQEKIVVEWMKNVKNKTNYDTRDAIGDITWFNVFKKENGFNCGELVYKCLKAVNPKVSIKKPALPASYVDTKYMKQIYITDLS